MALKLQFVIVVVGGGSFATATKKFWYLYSNEKRFVVERQSGAKNSVLATRRLESQLQKRITTHREIVPTKHLHQLPFFLSLGQTPCLSGFGRIGIQSVVC